MNVSRFRTAMNKPLCIDLFCGLGGWTEGFLAEGYDCIGFDIERHRYPLRDSWDAYPGQLVLQDVLTLHGSQFKDAAVIVASPPCQTYSYMAMPWSRGKQMAAEYRSGLRSIEELNALFNACFRIAKEANVPLIVENVRGAQPWVGPAKWNYGSFYLWGDVPALMPLTFKAQKGRLHGWSGGDGVSDAVKTVGHANIRDGHTHTRHLTNQRESDALKGSNGGRFNDSKRDGKTAATGYLSQSGSKSPARKAASAQIAKIPFPLARHIAGVFKPQDCELREPISSSASTETF